jgi:LPXTG-site transpeptidase (sortase) family protein
MNPKRTNYSITKPSRTSFSLGTDDYAAKTGRAQGSNNLTQQPSTGYTTQPSSQQKITQGSVQNDNRHQASPSLNFKARINYILNSGLHNPGYPAMRGSAVIVKLARRQVSGAAPAIAPQENAGPTKEEALDVGKFIIDHSSNQSEEPEEENAISLAAASLISDSRFKGTEHTIPNKLTMNAGDHLKSLSLKAKSNRHKIRSVVAASVACGIILVSSGLMYANYKILPEGNISGSTTLYVNKTESKSEAAAKVDSNSLQPNRLKISSLNIDAPSIPVGLTTEKAIDVPEKISDAAWYNGSALPGKPGTTFMLGHYAAGYGGIFDNLTKIKEGDIIEVIDHTGKVFKYKVTGKSKQKLSDINMESILTDSGEHRLVIMTCAGSYIARDYTDRFIVTATPVQ